MSVSEKEEEEEEKGHEVPVTVAEGAYVINAYTVTCLSVQQKYDPLELQLTNTCESIQIPFKITAVA